MALIENFEELIENMSRLQVKKTGLSRKFGKFRCSECKQQWHSAVVWCNEDGEAMYDQKCKACKTGVLPYEVTDLICSNIKIRVRPSSLQRPHNFFLCGLFSS